MIAGTGLLRGDFIPRFTDGFGYSRWGTSRDDVKAVFELSHKVERASATWDNGQYSEYTYIDTMAEMEYQVFPEFVHDSLYGVVLKFKVNRLSDGGAADAFRQLETILIRDNNVPAKVSPQRAPLGEGIDHAWFSVWDTYETEIDLFLVKYGDGLYDLGISYVCKELEEMYDPMLASKSKVLMSRTASELGVTTLAVVRAKWLLKLDESKIADEPVHFDRIAIPRLSEERPEPDEFVAVEQMPLETHHENPVYPEKAKSSGKSAIVWIQAYVDGEGRVKDARIVKSSGNDLGFDEAALDAAYKNVYRPAIQNGAPVPVWVSYKVDFKAPKQ